MTIMRYHEVMSHAACRMPHLMQSAQILERVLAFRPRSMRCLKIRYSTEIDGLQLAKWPDKMPIPGHPMAMQSYNTLFATYIYMPYKIIQLFLHVLLDYKVPEIEEYCCHLCSAGG